MPFVPDAPSSGGYFEPDEEKSLAGFGSNLMTDVKDTASGLGHLVQGIAEHPVDTVVGTAKQLPSALVNEGKRVGIGELLTGHPINAMNKLGNAFYDKPLTTGLEVIPAAGEALDALKLASGGSRAAEIAAAASKEIPAAAEKAATELVPIEGGTGVTGRSAIGGFPEVPPAAPTPVPPPPPAPVAPAAGAAAAPATDLLGSMAKKGAGALDEVNNYISSKYGQAAAKPGWPTRVAEYLQEEARKLGSKDLGLQGNQIRQMGEGFHGIKKAEALVDYAREQGYFNPGLTDLARKKLIETTLDKAGKSVGAIRDIAGTRGTPPIADMFETLKNHLTEQYGIKAPSEVKKVLAQVKRDMEKNPTFSGVAEISTDLNKELRNVRSMGRHVGPNTDAADILSRMNNDAIRGLLNEQEAEMYTKSLRDFGAHKKLEKAVAGSERRELAARSNQRGILGRLWQEGLDRGGYRVGGNIADRTAKAILKEPGKVSTLPKFFEELVHQADDVVDDAIHGMAHGGIVGNDELNDFLTSKYNSKEP